METEGYEGGYHRYSTFLFSLLSRLNLSSVRRKRIRSPEN